MENNDIQIDGFYYDPVKKRHFRISDATKYRSINSNGNSLSSPPSSNGPIKNVCSELTRLNMFDRNGLNIQECLLAGRFAQMKEKEIKKLDIYDFRGNQIKDANCDYLIGEEENDSLYGVWSSNDGNGSVVQRLKVNDLEDIKCIIINAYPNSTRVEDLCVIPCTDSPLSAVICLTNHCNKNLSTYSSANIYYLSNDTHPGHRRQAEDCSLNYEFREPSFSCCPYTVHTLAIGSEGHIRLFAPLVCTSRSNPAIEANGTQRHSSLELKGRATSLRFSQDGKRLYAGTNKGHLVSFDITSEKQIYNWNLSTKTINHLYPLKNNNQLIVSCHDSKLFLMDNRNSTAPIISFPNHVNSCKKIPVSVDESVDVLSSSGQDNKVRLWSLRSGKLLHEIPQNSEQLNHSPFVESSPIIHSWYSHSWKSTKGEPSPMVFTCLRDKIKVYRQPINVEQYDLPVSN